MNARTHCLVVSLAACTSPGFAAEGDAASSMVAKLAQTGELSCQPSVPAFCGNLHVSCSGQTSIKTFRFKLRATPSQGTIESAPETEALRAPYENARIEWDSQGRYVLLLPQQASGYIKLLSDGTYSFRDYAQDVAVMSIGRCN